MENIILEQKIIALENQMNKIQKQFNQRFIRLETDLNEREYEKNLLPKTEEGWQQLLKEKFYRS